MEKWRFQNGVWDFAVGGNPFAVILELKTKEVFHRSYPCPPRKEKYWEASLSGNSSRFGSDSSRIMPSEAPHPVKALENLNAILGQDLIPDLVSKAISAWRLPQWDLNPPSHEGRMCSIVINDTEITIRNRRIDDKWTVGIDRGAEGQTAEFPSFSIAYGYILGALPKDESDYLKGIDFPDEIRNEMEPSHSTIGLVRWLERKKLGVTWEDSERPQWKVTDSKGNLHGSGETAIDAISNARTRHDY